MEVAMNCIWLERAARLQVVPWPQVASPPKGAKRGLIPGIASDLGMMRDIVSTVGAWRVANQIMNLRRRRLQKPEGAAQPDVVQRGT
jgi:hypothetical protein